ncbi:hypothetical protein [Actinomadura bangladeshensis]|uniref:Uncharacterized protein n=1 Tax=Actinomadura bangladeshensis TaxID=453573 RepID=A0A6L9Q855_9ACTN|nr:hypothetical protein [Actinomadura bangladeshensis]NEA21597.1 hypothetical protein [Actinomadura bangladeshensis]NEA22557.1 hypothetical protein [Actinomadura bangladeshensis]
MSDDLNRVRQRRERRRSAAPIGAFSGPVGRQRAQIEKVLDKVRTIERRRGVPTPERITAALDICELYGPEVDEALGGQEPMVDEWETGERIPTDEQLRALSWLTGFSVDFFYLPPPPPRAGLRICGEDVCEVLTDAEALDAVTCDKSPVPTPGQAPRFTGP